MVRVARKMIGSALLCVTLGAAHAYCQDVAEAARQERERKAAQAKAPRHVYTEEDLKRTKILTPDDNARVISRKANSPVPEKKEVEPQVAEQLPSEAPSLGEVARRYRAEKAAQQAEQTAKNNKEEKSRYPLELPSASLAEPKPMVKPNAGSLREDELRLTPRPAPVAPAASGHSRFSPFAPRNPVTPENPQPVVPLAVVASSVQPEQVRPGDSWWRLAQRYLGKGSRWEELLRVNPGLSRDPNRLMAGTRVFVPGNMHARGSPPGAQIVVRAGDTLWSMAREHLGCALSWPALAAANPEVTNYKKLQIGTRLSLPSGKPYGCGVHTHPSTRN